MILPREPWRRNQYVTVATVFVVFTGFAFVIPFLPLYVRELGVERPHEAALWAGVLIGIATGWSAGRAALLVRSLVDVAVAVPPLIVALVTVLVSGPSTAALLLALIAVGWLPFARQADALVAELRTRNWVLAHRALGAGRVRIWRGSMLPFLAPATGALAGVRLPAMVNTVAALGFLGLGPPPPNPEWGAMIAESVEHLSTAPWLLLSPVVALVCAQVLVAAWGPQKS